MTKEIDNYMLIQEAAEKWGKPVDTVKNKLKPSVVGEESIKKMIDDGLIKYYSKPGSTAKNWIISVPAMEKWFGEKK